MRMLRHDVPSGWLFNTCLNLRHDVAVQPLVACDRTSALDRIETYVIVATPEIQNTSFPAVVQIYVHATNNEAAMKLYAVTKKNLRQIGASQADFCYCIQ